MSDFRFLAPRPPGEDPPKAESVTAIRKSKVAVACESCRLKRIKCDGAKPQCRACITRAAECTYAAPSAQLLVREQKSTIEELQREKGSLYEILWYLQTTSPEQATAMLDMLRASNHQDMDGTVQNMGAAVQHFAQNRQEVPPVIAPVSGAPSHAPELVDIGRLLDDRGPTQQDSAASFSHYATVQALEGPLEWFYNCVGALFYIMNRDDVDRSVKSIRGNQSPLGDIVAAGEDLGTTTIAAELAGMAAIGVVHAQLADPTTAPPAELADYFYRVAKLGLDYAIQYNGLRAAKICALLAMYNVIVHATVALAYLDLGISLARKLNIDADDCSSYMSPDEYTDASRTYRTLVHLQCWLSASLDYVPDVLGVAALSAPVDPNAPPGDMIRHECVKVTIIKACTLHRIPKTAPVPESIIVHFRAELSAFYAQLPDWMSLGNLLSDDENPLLVQFRPVIFYVHLFHLSAMMLLSRRLVIAYVALDATGKVQLPEEARAAIQEGFQAARTNARLMDTMMAEGKIVQVCWLCIFTSYTAGVMIAYAAAQSATRSLSFSHDMQLLNKCISVLSYCARKDALAGRFRDLLNRQLTDLQKHNILGSESPTGTPIEDTWSEDLFNFETDSSLLRPTIRNLLSLIRSPFNGLGDISAQETILNRAETTMGTHFEWQWELEERKAADNLMDWEGPSETACLPDATGSSSLPGPQGSTWTTWTPAKNPLI